MMKESLTHIDAKGKASMVDVQDKQNTYRIATAEGFVKLSKETLKAIVDNNVKKGDVLSTAKIAGIQAVKKTAELIPLCHPLSIEHIDLNFDVLEDVDQIRITCTSKLTGKTGVEMEALTGVSVAALTIYDMCKALDRGIEIGPVRLISKEGGASGSYRR
ncbi:MAG: cyclic pyranopterin monophosphate synthase MoaC [Pseudomonadota bacterium]